MRRFWEAESHENKEGPERCGLGFAGRSAHTGECGRRQRTGGVGADGRRLYGRGWRGLQLNSG